ncbi:MULTISPECIES: 2-succinyl-5-enolpyruvyl-6-hydroxy-3-cyclohexene-1-carboxylic-acid synthase [unclassified Leifsonia]|uniref:2-succinyl-5-enolpyruvyl-6-hydroxy-3- cyclohexene-1-carboxylic-acid synthase n=1 Tax=unclassified Leifsonia TaxID=2663824 RepID=UPI00035F1050|nr:MULTISPECIES: 2-succinyl-5-enolpyruvyl-6-hydroxy-3-cyclohexene-1-carboxylic-acid synthase [unclassified Leifsonia]TDQ02028.1 2-succinyl-5-enolpyruvyl-6-hydroxy-3-cyclohexene-1-carboxylate synthase [Leifsonia sp. 115AMFTsu3.1]
MGDRPHAGDVTSVGTSPVDPVASAVSGSAVTGNPATDFSLALLSALVRNGVRDLVVSPGSRSQALALAAAELERSGSARLHVRIDERSGGFLALGLARETGAPAVVVTTSGTATANLHPAVLEAHEAGIPLIIVTGDRPEELRGIRSNQTTQQDGLYASAVHWSDDVDAPTGEPGEADRASTLGAAAVRAAVGADTADPGPVHLNVAFREPLSVAVPPLPEPIAGTLPATAGPDALGREVVSVGGGPKTVVVAGADAGPMAEEFARDGGFPLLAEVSSGAHFGPNLVVSYRELLSDDTFGGAVERAIVFGHPTLSREVPALLTRNDVEVVVVAPTGAQAYNPGHRARIVGGVRAAETIDVRSPEVRGWVGRWVFASRRIAELAEREADPAAVAPDVEKARSFNPADALAFASAELAAIRAPITRALLAEAVWRYTWPHDRLVLGASRLIRDVDRIVPGKKVAVHANRGLAGIDGTIATATGIALASQTAARAAGTPSGVTRVLLGDLALLHDVGSLLFGAGETRPHLQVIVGNDGGGTIFDGLEVAATASSDAFDRVLYTPQAVDISALAKAYGWHHAVARTKGELDQLLSAPPAGTSIVEVPLPR